MICKCGEAMEEIHWNDYNDLHWCPQCGRAYQGEIKTSRTVKPEQWHEPKNSLKGREGNEKEILP